LILLKKDICRVEIKLPLGFCPKCKEEVLLKRNDIDICLIVLLTIFTAGIGTIIYLIIYYSDVPKRCIKCNSMCLPVSLQNKQKTVNADGENFKSKSISHKTINYCPACGSKIGNLNNKPNYCPFCGNNLKLREKDLLKVIDCAVCHQKVDKNQESITCSFCGTIFHYNCVSNWLLQHNACPLCQNRFIFPQKGQS
jgi:endogenous inhibitor of DNA gyrase (YacG/DUF329 family)